RSIMAGPWTVQSVRHRSPMTARVARPDAREHGPCPAHPQPLLPAEGLPTASRGEGKTAGLTPRAFVPTTRASWRPERPPETFRDPWQGLALSRLFLSGRGRPRSEEGAVPQRSTLTRGRDDQALGIQV